MNGPDEHGLLGVSTDHAARFADCDSREESGFLVQIIRHGRETWGDDAAGVLGEFVDDIEGHGGSEVDDDGRCAEVVGDGYGVGESVLADGFWAWVMDADAADGLWSELEGVEPEQLLEGGLYLGVHRGDHAAHAGVGRLGGTAEPLPDGDEIVEGGPISGAQIASTEDALAFREAEVRVSVADIDEQQW